MRDVEEGDLVLHLRDKIFDGFSRVSRPAREDAQGPPTPGRWEGMSPYYFIELDSFLPLSTRRSVHSFLEEHDPDVQREIHQDHSKWFPFCIHAGKSRLQQGMYLARCTPRLYQTIRDYLATDVTPTAAYSVEDALYDVFLSESEFVRILSALRSRKNLVLQGPPGVGKTYLAKRLGFALLGEKDGSRLESIQFHQSFAYEDFVQGLRPLKDGGFGLVPGVFYLFVRKAAADPDRPYIFIIDEINRGNLSKIFGETMSVIERDKRGSQHSVGLPYTDAADGNRERFAVPPNVHILGLMNTADRSLALLDYALRRRFTFVTLTPQFNKKFRDKLTAQGISEQLTGLIVKKVEDLNARIRSDAILGEDFEVGHSFFVPDDVAIESEDAWFRDVIEFEVGPLLREYWFDDRDKADEEIDALLE